MDEMQGYLLTLVMFMGALWDVRENRIPNWLTAAGLAAGGICSAVSLGDVSFIQFLLGAAAPAVLLYPLFYLHMIGAGDVKLLSAAGGFLGLTGSMACIMGSFLLGAVFSLCKCLYHKNLWIRLQYLAAYISTYLTTKTRAPYYKKEDGNEMTIPFGVPVFLWAALHMGGIV